MPMLRAYLCVNMVEVLSELYITVVQLCQISVFVDKLQDMLFSNSLYITACPSVMHNKNASIFLF